jgi:hypothetical protein
MTYRYIGDRLTDISLKGKMCKAVKNEKGKCIRGRNGTMLVSFDGLKTTVIARLLRKTQNNGI